jgi:hypothetical protein
VIRRALEKEGKLTRAELVAHFTKDGVPANGQQVPYLLQRAALDGLICHGPQRGHEPTYALIPDLSKEQRRLGRAEALGLLAGRYFASHGPATQKDFAWWAGLPVPDVRIAFDNAPTLGALRVNDIEYWATGDPPPPRAELDEYVLPPFDEFLLGYKERSLVLDTQYVKRVNAGGGMPKPTVVVNGEVIGTWSYKLMKHGMSVGIQPFRDADTQEQDAIRLALRRFSLYRSMPVDVSFIIAYTAG